MALLMQASLGAIQGHDNAPKGSHLGFMRKAKPRNTDLGRAITAHREAAEMTLEQVAKQLNDLSGLETHTKGTVGRWERGERGVSPTNQRYLAEVFGITVAELPEPPRPENIHRLLEGQPPEHWRVVADVARQLAATSKGR